MSLFAGVKWVSERVGPVMTLLGLPAAVVGLVAFGGELVDSLTAPDIVVTFPRLTIRCFNRYTDPADVIAASEGNAEVIREVCDANPLSVGFLASMSNDDRITRTVTNVTARLRLPSGAMQGEVEMDLPWLVSDEVHSAVATTIRRTLPELRLPALSTQKHEIWIEQTVPTHERVRWGEVRRWIAAEDGAQAGNVVEADIFIAVAGRPGLMHAATCRFAFRPTSLMNFRGWSASEQRAFTGACEEEPPLGRSDGRRRSRTHGP